MLLIRYMLLRLSVNMCVYFGELYIFDGDEIIHRS